MSTEPPYIEWRQFISTLKDGHTHKIRTICEPLYFPPYRPENFHEMICFQWPDFPSGKAYFISYNTWWKWTKYCKDHNIVWDKVIAPRNHYYIPEHLIENRRTKLASLERRAAKLRVDETPHQQKMRVAWQAHLAYKRRKERKGRAS